jgi:hypothetical protein
MNANFRRLIPVKERRVHLTPLDNPTPDPKSNHNPISFGGHIMSSSLPAIEPGPILGKRIGPSNWRERVDQISRRGEEFIRTSNDLTA